MRIVRSREWVRWGEMGLAGQPGFDGKREPLDVIGPDPSFPSLSCRALKTYLLWGTGKVTQCLRTVANFPEHSHLIPITHVVVYNHL